MQALINNLSITTSQIHDAYQKLELNFGFVF